MMDETLLGFAARLRDAGVDANLHRLDLLYAALRQFAEPGLETLYRCGRLTLCTGQDDLPVYDAVFDAVFRRLPQIGDAPPPPVVPALRPGAVRRQEAKPGEEEREEDVTVGAATDAEVLRHRNFVGLTPDERAQIHALILRLRAGIAMRPSRRFKPDTRSRLDVKRTVRAALALAGEPDRLYWRRRRMRPRRRILLIDVSGSMAPFAGGLLRFGYAATACAPRCTEVFTFGTRLTRVTPHLRHGDPEQAILAASQAIPDWSGGTRMGEQLRAFIDLWGRRGMARGAVVVIASDGWERGTPDLLREQMERLKRLAHTVIWANPHKSTPGFAPLTAGMQAALPFLDAFVGGSSAAELERLMRVMGGRQ
jgi:uncharacterized protein with von Willebrand factor type A (vWA) domain